MADGTRTQTQQIQVILHKSLTDTPPSSPLSTVYLTQGPSPQPELQVKNPNLEILDEKNDYEYNFQSFSKLLDGVIAAKSGVAGDATDFNMFSVRPTFETLGFEARFDLSHQEVLARVTAEAAQARADMGLQTPVTNYDLVVSNPTPITQQESLAHQDDAILPEVDQYKSADHENKPANTITTTPTTDGYNWRKYGQKQVKSSNCFRSYYKCTILGCPAKKVQHSDHSSRVIEIVYKGQHNHNSPGMIRCPRKRRIISDGLAVGSDTIDSSIQKLDGSESVICKIEDRQDSFRKSGLEKQNSSDSIDNTYDEKEDKLELKQRVEPEKSMPEQPKRKIPRPSSSDENSGIGTEKEHGDEQRLKRRMKERGTANSSPLCKVVKESKIVVHAAGDIEISSDGYRWRKYGQKTVKGNPHPRNYYRCTCADCPVRKHVERDTNNTTSFIITYEGKHNHDIPVPKKRHGLLSASLLLPPVTSNLELNKTEIPPNRTSSIQWPSEHQIDMTAQKDLELGGDKALESARTLLSIGIELRPC